MIRNGSFQQSGPSRRPTRGNWRQSGNWRSGQGADGEQARRSSYTPPNHVPPAPATILPDWSLYRSTLVIIRGVPPAANTWDIHESLVAYGNIVYIELDEDRRGLIHRTARVRFEPPPSDTSFFQNGRCKLVVNGNLHWPVVEFSQTAEDGALRTPLGNTCPMSISLLPPKLAFGVMTQPSTFMAKNTVASLGPGLDLKVRVDFFRKSLAIYCPVRPGNYFPDRCFRFDIKFSIIKEMYRTDLDNGRSALVMTLKDPPRVWKKKIDVASTFYADRMVWYENDIWQRAVEISRDPGTCIRTPISLNEDYQIIDIGRWLTYWFEMDEASKPLWSAIETHLRDWNIKTKRGSLSKPVPDTKPQLWSILDHNLPAEISVGAATSWNHDLSLLGSVDRTPLPFDVRYQLEVCIAHGILSEYNIGRDFIDKLTELSDPTSMAPDRARLALEYAADRGQRIYNPMDLFDDSAAMAYYPTTMDLPSHCALVRRVTITPTRIYFNTPTVETTNRVVRHFRHVQENFIRAQFTDELLEGRITGSEADRDDQIYTRAFRVLDYGIRIGQWHWKFLAFGNSQIRENGAFFFCEPEGRPEDVVTCEKIRKWMGRFNHIKVVAKYAARLGQCFSTTRLVPGISAPRIVKIPDVEKGKYCFTDGVGKISALLAGMVAQDWKIYPPPSAYQFRMGGCKGVLVTSPDAKGTEVHIRKSQEKFFAEFNGLEVIRCSRFSCATLNRQTITILSSLGVPDSVFVGLMAEQLSNYNDAMTNKSRAVQLLSRYVDENQTTLSIARMVLDGFMETRDPFVQTLLQLWRSWSIKSLKEKARLIVDEGAFVLGCVDETGTLRGHSKAIEGRRKVERDELPQIFIQVPNPDERGAYKVITGLCLVGRNPSLHPGDIRVVEAIDVPGLRHIRDVVVFPLKGDRDVPSMCSGGDLDGDDFFVIWDQKMIPSERCHPPMDYTPPAPIQELVGPSADSLKAFFVLFMKNNTLPLIAHAHLATADREPDGPKNDRCIKLAQLHSMAVDYVKTGVPAEWSKRLDPRKWPHFMEKNRKGTYHSSMALGQLYDMVKKEMFDSKESYKLPFDSRVLKKYNLDNDILKKARQIKSKYDIGMRRTMGQLEIKTEFEVWTTFVLSKPRVGSSYKMQEDVGRESAALKQQYREMCIKAAGGSRDFEKMAPFVAAMYRVTSEEVRIALYEARQQHVRPDGTVGLRKISARSMPLISFPWLFESYLGRIATGSDTESKLADLVPSIPTKPKSHGLISQSILEMEPDEAYTRTSDGQIIHRGEILHLFNHEDDDDEVDYDPDERPTSESPAKSDMEGIWDTQNKPGASDETSLPDKEAGIDRAIPPKETLGEASNLHEDGFVIDNPAQQPAGDRAETFPQTPVLRPTANTDEEEQADLLDLTPSVSASKRSKSMTESSVGFADASVGWSPVKTIYQESKTEDTTRELDDKEISFVDETEASSLTNGNSPYITDARTGSSGEPIIPTDDEAETEAYEAVIESVIANPQEHPVLDSRGKGTEVMASVNGSVDLLGIDDRFTDKAGKSRPKSPYHEDLMALSQQPGSRNGPFTAESRTELDNTKVAVNGFMLQEEHILHSRPQSEPGNGDVAGAAFNSDRLIAISPVKLQAPVRAPMQALSVYTLSRRLAAITGTGGHNQSASTGFDLPSQDVPETATGTDTGTKGSNYDSEDDSRDHGLAAITMATDDGDIYSPCASEKEDAADDGSDLGSELEYEEEVVVIEDETALERTLKLLAS